MSFNTINFSVVFLSDYTIFQSYNNNNNKNGIFTSLNGKQHPQYKWINDKYNWRLLDTIINQIQKDY